LKPPSPHVPYAARLTAAGAFYRLLCDRAHLNGLCASDRLTSAARSHAVGERDLARALAVAGGEEARRAA
jgi:hypothetical protein